jgi:hypothetical protein
VGLVVLVIALVLVPAAPAFAYWRGGFWIGLGTGMLLTAPFWYGPPSVYYYPPYPYAYPYPYASPYPAYAPPPAAPAYAPPPATPTTPTPSPLAAPPGAPGPSAQPRCETVTVEGHYETYVTAGGQASTVWVPAGPREICQ